jgi:hypothetical protein
MYSFSRRSDTVVVDEPLYGYYLRQTGANHPGREEVINNMPHDPEVIFENIRSLDKHGKVIFLKNMGHHFAGLDIKMILSFKNIFLVRDPADMLPSLSVQIPQPALRDTGLRDQWNIFTLLKEAGQTPQVLDARILLEDPGKILSMLCGQLGIHFMQSMLSWPKGPKSEDGIWAKYWYQKVHQSTGFGKYEKKDHTFHGNLDLLLSECRPYYENFMRHVLRPEHA